MTEKAGCGGLAFNRIFLHGWTFERVVKFALLDAQRLRTLYKTASGAWTENRNDAEFKRDSPAGALYAEYQDVRFWEVNGVRFDDCQAAFDAMYDALFVKPAILPILNRMIKKFRKVV